MSPILKCTVAILQLEYKRRSELLRKTTHTHESREKEQAMSHPPVFVTYLNKVANGKMLYFSVFFMA